MTITDDEFACLMIAARGEYMLAIGRWERSIQDLAAKGLMRSEHINGGSQYTITKAGRAAIEEREQEENQQLADVINRSRQAKIVRGTIQDFCEQAAKLLVDAARASMQITGESPQIASRKWNEVILRRALELLDG